MRSVFTTIATHIECGYPNVSLRKDLVMVLTLMMIICLLVTHHVKQSKLHMINHLAHASVINIDSTFVVVVLPSELFVATNVKKHSWEKNEKMVF